MNNAIKNLLTRELPYDTIYMYRWITDAKQVLKQLCDPAVEPLEYKLTADRSTIVAPSVKWKLIDADTPVGVKMLLINKANGVASIGARRAQDDWTHWCSLPTFDVDKIEKV